VKWSQATLFWLLAYFAMTAAIVCGLLHARRVATAVYGTADAQAEWNTWREDARRMAEEPSPVKRRAPKSVEPPALVLMLDYFGVCLGLVLVLSTVLFGTFMVLVRGALSSSRVGSAHQRIRSGGHSPPYKDP